MRVVGVGNRYRGDDGVGLVVAERVRRSLPDVDVVLREGEPIELLEAWAGHEAVIVVDAVCGDGPPGRVHRLDAAAGRLPAALFASSTHHLGLADAVEIARALDRLPQRLIVIGVEGESFDAGEGLSQSVALAVADAVAAVEEEVRACTSAP